MRKISKIIIHCTATKAGQDVSVAQIDQWHKERGFAKIGYHYVIGINGEVKTGRPEEEPGAHCVGHNTESIGVCYVGGLDEQGKPCDTRTETQKTAMLKLITNLLKKHKGATLHGHREFANKECPCFDVQEEYAILC